MTTSHRPHTAGRVARGAGAFTAAAVLLAAPPAALIRFVGWPLPRSTSALRAAPAVLTQPLDDRLLINALACVVWLLWAMFTLALLVELGAAARGSAAPRLPGLSPLQALAAALVSSATIAVIPVTARAGLPPIDTPIAAAATTQPAAATQPAPGRTTAGAPNLAANPAADRAQHSPRTYRVAPHDSLWAIAEHQLGDPQRWEEIFHLNRHRPQPDGHSLHDPNIIRPGWVLLLPDKHAHPTSPPTHTKPSPRPRHPPPPRTPDRQTPGTPGQPGPPNSPTPSTTPPALPAPPGAVGQPPHTPTAGPSTPHPSPAPSRTDADHEHRPVAVTLPSGAIIGPSLAIAISLAVAAARLHRRRRRIPAQVPGTSPADPPLPPTLARARHAHLATRRDPDQAPPLTYDEAPATPAHAERTADPPQPEGRAGTDETVNVSLSDERELPLQLDRTAGVGLIGEGATGAARCIAVSLLARHDKDQPQVIVDRTVADELFGDDINLDAVPGMTVTADLQEALARLQAEIIHRDRLVDATGTSDFAAYRACHPDEPLPTMLLIARPDSHLTERTASILALGRHRGIVGLILNPWNAGTCAIRNNGHVSARGDAVAHLHGTRMFQMALDEADIMLATLAAARGHDQPDQPPTPQPAPPARDLPEPSTEPLTGEAPSPQRAVELFILGPLRLQAGGAQITTGLRRKGYELLAYLALHPDGATTDTLLDVLWPQAAPEDVTNSFYTLTSNIRRVLRDATGAGEAEFLLHTTDRYRLDPALITVDLWQYRNALARAAHAPDDDHRIQALTQAVSIWTGNLDAWPATEWLEPWRETLRRDAIDTLARLAELLHNNEPERALALLEQATTHDQYAEELYRRIMKLQAHLGRRDAVRRTYQLLEARLTDIDAEPDQETADLLHKLLAPMRP